MKKKCLFILFLTLILIVSGCSGGTQTETVSHSDSQNNYEDSAVLNSDSDVANVAGAKQSNNDSKNVDNENNTDQGSAEERKEKTEATEAEKKEEKLVYTCNMQIETTTYSETIDEINKVIKKYSGIIDTQRETDSSYNWYYDDYEKTSGTMEMNVVVRIPSKNYNKFLNDLNGKGKIVSKDMNVQNITKTYYDTTATIESLKIQEQRLLDMLKEAKGIEEMLSIENRLTEVQTQLNQYKNELSVMDTEVEFSTVTLNIREVLEYKENDPARKTNHFIDRLMSTIHDSIFGFLSFLEWLLFFIIRLFPFAILFAAIWKVSGPLRAFIKKKDAERIKARDKRIQELKEKMNEMNGNKKKE